MALFTNSAHIKEEYYKETANYQGKNFMYWGSSDWKFLCSI